MPDNKGLRQAAKADKDEFYTPMDIIEDELVFYKSCFRDKIVYCSCDDPFKSNFFKYFLINFNDLGLKKLICTNYSDFQDTKSKAYKVEVTNTDSREIHSESDIQQILQRKGNTFEELQGDGDFRSYECIQTLKDSDIVVTNPPFSLFKDFITQLVEYNKKFLIIGNVNAVSNKKIFPLIRDRKVWLGVSIHSGDRKFYVRDDYELSTTGSGTEDGRKYIKVKGVRWFTNIYTGECNNKLHLTSKYDPELYPKYDYYDAINIDSCKDIPCDYYGNMGVPLTFIDKWCPEQFELVDGMSRYTILTNEQTKRRGLYCSMVDGKTKFFRLIIRRRDIE